MLFNDDTIIALATPPMGASAISVIRLSGKQSIYTVDSFFISAKHGKKLQNQSTHTIHLGYISDNKNKKLIDQVLISIFREPYSYTGENMIEISCHGSQYIQEYIIKLFLEEGKGIRLANPGEFTFRAFLNKKIDLSQAEAIYDIIYSENKTNNEISLQQIKGTLKESIKSLRTKLLNFSSLLELELDFPEENNPSLKKSTLLSILKDLQVSLNNLIESFSLGNAIKTGIIVVIIGNTNVGKSTLFNQILQENRSIVSHVSGTTRDSLEGNVILKGIPFRFVDTAGIRKTTNPIELLGINKTLKSIKNAHVILYLFEAYNGIEKQKKIIQTIQTLNKKYPMKKIFAIANKSDISSFKDFCNLHSSVNRIFDISSKNNQGINKMLDVLSKFFFDQFAKKRIIVTNNRHYEALKKTLEEISIAYNALALNNNISIDLISLHIRESFRFLGQITGEITNEEVLSNIFSKFCIGK
ncbi:tRNA uridine-5-carboxymethylaminomethyl(34) synthesis GTPase MnmE [Blattabacterium cuenoti]|uniref:tRNA uridine-5-carboxymethylaminomethyl(34) synthesis GTPase MnmE n=1 Tax=Blattabacterium cuenoti TaxID=1653831 RepID=UPI00163D1B32|nr:tRNA uridine-5-carboxymethylaminomethyl(34) synthesis GTPase MnmE [Blattabacterium cuenoti]